MDIHYLSINHSLKLIRTKQLFYHFNCLILVLQMPKVPGLLLLSLTSLLIEPHQGQEILSPLELMLLLRVYVIMTVINYKSGRTALIKIYM